jgi:transcription elongation factor Elf1
VDDSAQIKDTDIIFDCPHCGKSLAIDYRGAGLTIPCTDCGKSVQVPIPEGMEISDLDTTNAQQEALILNLRKSLAAAEDRIQQMESDMESVGARRTQLEKERTEGILRLNLVAEKMALVRRTLDEVARILEHREVGRPYGGTPPAPRPPH